MCQECLELATCPWNSTLATLELEGEQLVSLPAEMQALGWRCLAVFCPYHPSLVAACGVRGLASASSSLRSGMISFLTDMAKVFDFTFVAGAPGTEFAAMALATEASRFFKALASAGNRAHLTEKPDFAGEDEISGEWAVVERGE